ncbi:MAG: hypothetical protein ABIS49_11110 [Aestuariivirga sp.]
MSSAEYARRLNVTRSAVSKWANDPFIARQIDRQHSMRVGMQIAKNLKARDKAIEVAVEEELEREANQRATSITAWVNSNWPGDDKIKVPFPGPDDAPLARLEVINFMVQHNMIPAGHQREARNRALRKGGFSLTWPRQKA